MLNRIAKALCFAGLGALLAGPAATAQSLKVAWSKEFAKPVAWYVRTSAGVLLARVGKGLVAVEEKEGQQLWMLPAVNFGYATLEGVDAPTERGRNMLEVPGLGVLLLNRVKLPGDSEWQLLAVNLMTGKKLWSRPPVNELMTAVPLYRSGGAVLVSRRVQKKMLITEDVALSFAHVPYLSFYVYPYRFELERVELATGKTIWSQEYGRTFTPGSASVQAIGGQLFLYFGNRVLGCLRLSDGKFLWEDGEKHIGSGSLPLQIENSDGRLIYGTESIQAVDPATGQAAWTIEDLGKPTGLFVHDGMAVAIGEKRIAAVDTLNGRELWRAETHGHTTNLAWEPTTDALIYADWRGLHSLERTSGRRLADVRLNVDSQPFHVRVASPEVVVTVAILDVCAFNLKTGKKLFSAGKMAGFFPAAAFLDNWPMPVEGHPFGQMSRPPAEEAEWDGVRQKTLLTAEALKLFEENSAGSDTQWDAYESGAAGELAKVWWIDPVSNQRVEVSPSWEQHDMNRRARMVFSAHDIGMWGAAVPSN